MICMYIHIHTCMYDIHIHDTHIYIHVYLYMYVYDIHVYVCVRTCISMCILTHGSMLHFLSFEKVF